MIGTEIATCHPDYYKWMQWIFIQFFNKGLAYKRIQSIGVLPVQTVLANEQVVDGCVNAVILWLAKRAGTVVS